MRHSDSLDYEPLTAALRRDKASNESDPHQPFRRASSLPKASGNDEQFTPLTESADKSQPLPQAAAKIVVSSSSNQQSLLQRGHSLTYVCLFLFTAVLFFRPYELFSALSGLTSLAFWIGVATLAVFIPTQLALTGSITERPREVNLVLLLTLAALLSIPLAINPREAWDTFADSFIRAVLIFVVIVNVVKTERRLKGLLSLALGVGLLLSVAAVADYRAGNLADQGRRIIGLLSGMFGNPNDLALYLVSIFPIAIALMLASRNILLKISFFACAAVFVAAIVATFSRGGFLGLVGAGLVLTWKLGRRQRFVTMSIALVAIVAFVLLSPGGYADRILSIFGLRPDPVGSAQARQNLLTHSVLTVLRHPLGIGMGNYHIVAAREAVSHNAYTQVAAELGIPALAIYLWFVIAPLKRLSAIERTTADDKNARRFYYLAIGLYSGLVGYMISSFFASVAYQWYIYYLVGYSVCLHSIYFATVGLTENWSEPSK